MIPPAQVAQQCADLSLTPAPVHAALCRDPPAFSHVHRRCASTQVRETFTVAANLRLPRKMSAAEKQAVVDAIITELGLAKAANTRIGMQFQLTTGTSNGPDWIPLQSQ